LYAQGFFTESAAANDRAAELTTMRQEAGDGNALGVGGRVLPPRVIRRVEPGYPAGANPGLVILEATIGADGQMHDVRVLRSVPGLDEAATIALWKWRFAPTLLNGSAVPVVLTVTMNFVG
jgi:TonB family protein